MSFPVYVTKYALSEGVQYYAGYEVETTHTESMIVVKAQGTSLQMYFHGEGRDWHRTKEAAITRAQAMRRAKIASLNKQIKKLEALKF